MNDDLFDLAAQCSRDPYKFVLVGFDWGHGDLADFPGPDDWQKDILCSIRDGLLTPDQAVRVAVASGHGIGKSALVSWIILWALVTCIDAKGVVTANTENQLKTKTWAEVAKWHRLCLWADWFKYTATALFSVEEGREKTWRIDMVPWSERNTEAFAGLHNKGKRVLLVFDEASAIPDIIWEVSEGALTDEGTEIIWAGFGNPTRNTGRFKECFGRFRHRWVTRQIDSRTARMTNKAQLQEWVDDYGEDSDFVRVRVKGQFPRAGDMQFIGSDTVEEAQARENMPDPSAAIIVGVDVARFGEDSSVIATRQGRKLLDIRKYYSLDTMQLAAMAVEAKKDFGADATFIDGGGVGGGVIDRLKLLGHTDVFEVQAGSAPKDRKKYKNKRAEIWDKMRTWLKTADIPQDQQLADDLIGPMYGYDDQMRLQLEKKEDMKKRGLASPDVADALAMTFAEDIAKLSDDEYHNSQTAISAYTPGG